MEALSLRVSASVGFPAERSVKAGSSSWSKGVAAVPLSKPSFVRRSQSVLAVRAEISTQQSVSEAEVTDRPSSSSAELSTERVSSGKSLVAPTPAGFVSRYGDNEPRKGCDILVEALEREGVRTVFAYPGGASLEIHQVRDHAQ